tara:strand:+ start:64 stop:201 length:138 start_codon:yes stop_codon:yes gene_type:complete
MKYLIIITIMSIAGTAGVVFENEEPSQIPVEHIDFVEPIYITVGA